MYNEFFKNIFFSSTWRIYVAHGRIHVILHLTCLNVILNILSYQSAETFALVVFAVGHLLPLALVTTSPDLPYILVLCSVTCRICA